MTLDKVVQASGGSARAPHAWKSVPRWATAILSRLAKLGLADQAQQTLKELQKSVKIDVVHWGAASQACRRWPQSLDMVQSAKELGILPNEFVFSAAVTSCTQHRAWRMVLDLFSECSRRRRLNDFLNVGAIAALSWESSLHLLETTRDRHIQTQQVTFSAAMGTCSKAQVDLWRAASGLLESMSLCNITLNIVACNTHADACAGARRWQQALAAVRKMTQNALQVNLISFNSALAACEKGYEWKRCLSSLSFMETARVMPEIISFGSSISACEKGMQWHLASEHLQHMCHRRFHADAVALSAAMSACEKAGQWEAALVLLKPTLGASRGVFDLSCAFSAALSAAERGGAWVAALALLDTAARARCPLSGMFAGAVASGIRKAHGEEAAVEFLTRSRWQWEGASPPKAVNLDTGDLLPGVQILAEAPGLVVIAKESDVRTEVLVNAARKLMRQELFVVSRLDRPTSGLLPLARGLHAMNWLQAQFAGRLVHKEYACLCEGSPLGPVGTCGCIDTPLHAWNWAGEVGRTVVAPFGREAITEYEVKERFRGAGSELMLLSVQPRTGRMHQIRAHLASISRPIVGDVIYGNLSSPVQCHRLFLHCQRLQLWDLSSKPLAVSMPLPPALQRYLEALRQPL
ncbi:unnamed protein product [Effrenium voratum]|uniref:Pseudouridine synthase RsuA/RluA-like domain-containing protein n=1 Tax=Effrenium voratum TaxID=2562239 RepID=A0AA36JMW7_9DINO|nr:unnamed protein product [Effrenium voratum]